MPESQQDRTETSYTYVDLARDYERGGLDVVRALYEKGAITRRQIYRVVSRLERDGLPTEELRDYIKTTQSKRGPKAGVIGDTRTTRVQADASKGLHLRVPLPASAYPDAAKGDRYAYTYGKNSIVIRGPR